MVDTRFRGYDMIGDCHCERSVAIWVVTKEGHELPLYTTPPRLLRRLSSPRNDKYMGYPSRTLLFVIPEKAGIYPRYSPQRMLLLSSPTAPNYE